MIEIAPQQPTMLLRIEQVAEKYHIPLSTLRYWRQMGTGPRSAKLGRRVVYRPADVEAWIAAQFGETVETAASVTDLAARRTGGAR